MRILLFYLCLGLQIVLPIAAHAGPWTSLVEELAERAAGAEARSAGERTFVFRESDDAARLSLRRRVAWAVLTPRCCGDSSACPVSMPR